MNASATTSGAGPDGCCPPPSTLTPWAMRFKGITSATLPARWRTVVKSELARMLDFNQQKISRMDYRDSHTGSDCAADYEAHYTRGRGYFYWQYFEKPYLKKLFARLGKEFPGRYLDFACGTGRILQLGAPYFAESFGIDVSETMLAVARRSAPTTRLIRADVTTGPPDVGPFTVISLFRFL